MNYFENKKILLIICGGISAYKSLELIRLFKKEGAEIKTILTKNSKKFITPLSVASLSQGKVYDYLFICYSWWKDQCGACTMAVAIISLEPIFLFYDSLAQKTRTLLTR